MVLSLPSIRLSNKRPFNSTKPYFIECARMFFVNRKKCSAPGLKAGDFCGLIKRLQVPTLTGLMICRNTAAAARTAR